MKYVFKELKSHLWRTIMSITGYVIATLFVILLISVTRYHSKDTETILRGTGTHFIVYVPSGEPYNNVPFDASCCIDGDYCTIESGNDNSLKVSGSLYSDGVYTKLLSRNFLNQIKQVDGVKDAAPYLLYRKYEKQFDREVSFGGMDPNSIATTNNVCAPNDIIEGKFLPGDTSEVVAEESFARAFNLHIGDTIEYCSKQLKVAGIINSGVKPGKADLYTTFNFLKHILKDQIRLNMSGFDLNVILVEVADSRNQAQVMDAIKLKNQYASLSSYNCYKPASAVMGMISKASGILYALVFLFLIVFAVKTQTTALMERLREIGILRSLGWSNGRLAGQIVAGSVFQSITGTIIGIALSLPGLYILNQVAMTEPQPVKIAMQWSEVAIVQGLSLTGAIFASLFPIIRMSRLSVGDIMRNYL